MSRRPPEPMRRPASPPGVRHCGRAASATVPRSSAQDGVPSGRSAHWRESQRRCQRRRPARRRGRGGGPQVARSGRTSWSCGVAAAPHA
ncbi:hypothetical protein AE618_03205 [Bosea vaviloviae]|uniref:Uncharacterized protein n=1 Tax=Bosea vaviloviae TaxID=1526658 RepID=A0A0N1FKM0_9HYPH|nr:hypothetical protein AE618_03205 [Bosea vaviloviae]